MVTDNRCVIANNRRVVWLIVMAITSDDWTMDGVSRNGVFVMLVIWSIIVMGLVVMGAMSIDAIFIVVMCALMCIRVGICAWERLKDGMLVEVDRLHIVLVVKPVVQDMVVLMLDFMALLVLVSWIAGLVVLIVAVRVLVRRDIVA